MSGILGCGSMRNCATSSGAEALPFGDRGEGRNIVRAARLVGCDDMAGRAPSLGELLRRGPDRRRPSRRRSTAPRQGRARTIAASAIGRPRCGQSGHWAVLLAGRAGTLGGAGACAIIARRQLRRQGRNEARAPMRASTEKGRPDGPPFAVSPEVECVSTNSTCRTRPDAASSRSDATSAILSSI